ncbi:MAG: glycosyltransferase family 4 protein [Bacteroidetes bacterium]|nr:glycosyltransferase family 4 protein [Bacteroidota bacterium]
MKKRIGLIFSKVPAYSETFFRNKIAALEEAGYTVVVLAGGGRRPDQRYAHISIGYDTYSTGITKALAAITAALRLMGSPRRTIRLYRKNQQDGFSANNNLKSLLNAAHIIGHRLDWLHFGFASNALYLENLAAIMGAKMAVSIRGFDISIQPLKQPGCYALLWKRIDKLHYISDALYRKALADGLSPLVAAVRIEPAADLEILRWASTPTPAPDKVVRFLTIGRLSWKKGYVQTFMALAALKAGGQRFTYRIVGDGDDIEMILYMRKALGLEQEVVLEGRKSHPETLQLLNACDIYLQYSVQEGYCNAVVEAQLFGRPCIVSDAEGLPENVIHGVTGWVVPANHPERLHEKITEVLALSAADQAMVGTAASARIRQSLSLEGQLQKFISFYES